MGSGAGRLEAAIGGTSTKSRAFAILDAAADAGVDFFDTADVYGGGRSEQLIGRFLKRRSEEFFVATKLGRAGMYPDKYTGEAVRAATESSLRNLGVETLDLTQLHCVPHEVLRNGEIFEWLRKLRSEGKIRSFGASVESMEEARTCLEQEGLASLQIIFNVFRQKPIDELFEAARAKGVAIIVRLPLASGLLAGKFSTDTEFAENDHRNYNRDGGAFNVGETFAGLPFETGVALAESLKGIMPSELSLAEAAQRWILDYPAVTTVITGASRPEQVRANAGVSDLAPLPENLHEQLAVFYAERVADQIRGPY